MVFTGVGGALAPKRLFVLFSALFCSCSLWAQEWPDAVGNIDCDRECLFERVDLYLEGLVQQEPSLVPWAEHVKFTENNVPLRIGDGIWGTITGLGDYDLRAADVETGQVTFFGEVQEPDFSSLMAMRLKVEDKLISEVEMVILRTIYEPKSIVWPEANIFDKPIFNEMLEEDARRPRERMISVVDGYFDTLQLNDGTLYTEFHEDCNRVENGTLTTHNPDVEFTAVGALGCEEQFRQGNYRYDDRLRARRYPLVDEERGLVLASGFIDHAGALDEYTLADGTLVDSPIRFPHSFYLLELFKVDDGKIRQVEAVFVTVPYGMGSPWLPSALPSIK